MKDFVDVINAYVSEQDKTDFHRFRSWEFCFKAFSGTENLELNLGFYLASWGMYRGSCGLLQRNYNVHGDATKIIKCEKYWKLRCTENSDVSTRNIYDIIELGYDLRESYKNISPIRIEDNKMSISPTDTLITKIILGTLGCTPAYDRFFRAGLKLSKFTNMSFNKDSLIEIFNFIQENKLDIVRCQKIIHPRVNSFYPKMKIIDMYFWYLGYQDEQKKNHHTK